MDRLSALFRYLELLRMLEEVSPVYGNKIDDALHEIELELEIKHR